MFDPRSKVKVKGQGNFPQFYRYRYQTLGIRLWVSLKGSAKFWLPKVKGQGQGDANCENHIFAHNFGTNGGKQFKLSFWIVLYMLQGPLQVISGIHLGLFVCLLACL